mmetsp:Transcript_413/g.682  ORF Transcript_413/g.682 Transcript_413/m.682 type:complete len:705 (+) Transcript_413:291-2405(+)|eukprot:CAMPEP_0197530842 /NCGR_PEP_ID=MMETSP1318-20131121/33081_1 /TAXON_ID=552666 /ORGANISM="Partenskyella glossopodia, Strain RCC365" /LENGTH=704 /DNA_ID=CAMNT_0043086823 /DNA_START=130 /DNA_END=2244 /DNA_ORIENTATION=+
MQSQSSFDSDEDIFHDTVDYESDGRATPNILLKEGAKLPTVKVGGVADPGDVQQKPVDAAGIADDSKRDARQEKPNGGVHRRSDSTNTIASALERSGTKDKEKAVALDTQSQSQDPEAPKMSQIAANFLSKGHNTSDLRNLSPSSSRVVPVARHVSHGSTSSFLSAATAEIMAGVVPPVKRRSLDVIRPPVRQSFCSAPISILGDSPGPDSSMKRWPRPSRPARLMNSSDRPRPPSVSRKTSDNIVTVPTTDSKFKSSKQIRQKKRQSLLKTVIGAFQRKRQSLDRGDGSFSNSTSKSRDTRHIDIQSKNSNRFCELRSVQLAHRRAIPDEPKGALWVLKASECGNYIAVGGQDPIVRVFKTLSLPPDAKTKGNGSDTKHADSTCSTSDNDKNNIGNSAETTTNNSTSDSHSQFDFEPFMEYSGHKADVIDFAWSKSGFLLSASIDGTARLWHMKRGRCLCVFRHPDYVTSVAFHPLDDTFFISGCFDRKLRIWSIPGHHVAEWAQAGNIITAVSFSPDGQTAVAGLYNGLCTFYESYGLKYITKIECRNRFGKHKTGRKITGLEFTQDGTHLLVTTNDSRIRLYNVETFTLASKFKGLSNSDLPIKAHLSLDQQYVICGSDDQSVYVWKWMPTEESTLLDTRASLKAIQNKPVTNEFHQSFKASNDTVTSALFIAWKGKEYIATADFKGILRIFSFSGLGGDT